MSNKDVEINYEKLAHTIIIALQKSGQILQAQQTPKRGTALITSDDCVNMGFTLGSRDYKFVKAGHDSWVETVKHSHRNNKPIEVTDDGITHNDGSYKPTDIHDA